MFKKVMDNLLFVAPSKRSGKKYDVYSYRTNKYITSFGAKDYEQYYDKIGYYSNLDHLDPYRKKLYYIRHKRTNDKRNARYYSNKYLW